jgi:hypothetical protein
MSDQPKDGGGKIEDLGGWSTPMGEAVAQLRELYISLKAGGFTKDEALTICVRVLRGDGGAS